jgi:hypothetical protein
MEGRKRVNMEERIFGISAAEWDKLFAFFCNGGEKEKQTSSGVEILLAHRKNDMHHREN